MQSIQLTEEKAAKLSMLCGFDDDLAKQVNATTSRLVKRAPKIGLQIAQDITRVLSEQAVVVIGTTAASLVQPRLTEQLAVLRR